MAMTTYTGNTSIISGLGTTPQERGLTADQFKAKFDEALTAFVTWFNTIHKTEFDAKANTIEWTTWTPTLVWTTATPINATVIAKYIQIGKVVYFSLFIQSSNGNGTTNLTIGLPINPLANSMYPSVNSFQIVSSTKTNPIAAIDDGGVNNRIYFYNFATATAGNSLSIVCTGFYPVA
jgi:hypothetical protein